jgi:hypothetical protein
MRREMEARCRDMVVGWLLWEEGLRRKNGGERESM